MKFEAQEEFERSLLTKEDWWVAQLRADLFNFLIAVKSEGVAFETAEEWLVKFESHEESTQEEPRELTKSEIHRLSKEARQRHGLKALAKAGKIKLVRRERKNEDDL